ncbi:hypothetical protein G6F64_015618 [Rhizopus arrhizus]|uniref:Uncharacterized protein n=1 Tax=Rhizopus oryzae TaxID=64495 RepID=A0A9P7BIN5_RHIOR|nr:hypothetical protein G6F64_015618 [Rhizopus arrhizus]
MSKSAYASPASCLARVTCRAAAAASTWACTELNRWLPSPPPTTAPPLNARRRGRSPTWIACATRCAASAPSRP